MSISEGAPVAGGLASQADIAQEIRRFIVEEIIVDPYRGEDPLREGEVDSLGIEMIVEYIWEAFRVELDEDELVQENFESLATLAALVDSKRPLEDEGPHLTAPPGHPRGDGHPPHRLRPPEDQRRRFPCRAAGGGHALREIEVEGDSDLSPASREGGG